MIGKTHASVGAATAWLVVLVHGISPSIALPIIASFFALIPDIDASDAKIKHLGYKGIKPLAPFAFIFSNLFKHRGFFHSFLFGIILYVTGLTFYNLETVSGAYILAALYGFYSHLFLDALTKSGIYFLWPYDKKLKLLPKILAVKTGGLIDEIFFICGSMGTLLYYLYFLEKFY